MTHGIDAYFLESRRFERRLSGTLALVMSFAAILLGALGYLHRHPSPALERLARNIPLLHWGFEGPEQYVRHIELQSESGGVSRTHPGMQAQYIPGSRKGGAKNVVRRAHPNAAPEVRMPAIDEGDSQIDRLARARARLMNLPLVRSEDLVIEHLVRPDYPEEAQDRNLEGHVAVLALVDTTGEVMTVELVGNEHEGLLERAAQDAVWKCRFRPYRIAGQAQRVYAMFRFAFRMD